MQNNPFFRAKTNNGQGVDINLNSVAYFQQDAAGQGTTLTFNDGSKLDIDLSPAAVRGRTRKAWPSAEASSDAE